MPSGFLMNTGKEKWGGGFALTKPIGRQTPRASAPGVIPQRLHAESSCGILNPHLKWSNMIYWFTGQPGSGKTTLAIALKSALKTSGQTVVHLEGEFLRKLTGNGDFSEGGRVRNIKAGQQLAAQLHAEGISVVASFVSPYRDSREEFKRQGDVLEIYVHTSAIRGRESFFVAGYEPPQKEFVDIDTTDVSVEKCVRKILQAVPGGG